MSSHTHSSPPTPPTSPPTRPAPSAPASALGRVAAFTLRHRTVVALGWLVVFVAGVMGSGQLSGRMSADFSLPGQPGYETAKKISALYGSNGAYQAPTLVVVTAGSGEKNMSADGPAVTGAFTALQQAIPGSRVIDYANTHDKAFLTNDGRSTFALVMVPPAEGFGSDPVATAVDKAVKPRLAGDQVGVTGMNQLASSKGTGVLTETLIGAAGALLVLLFVFASFLAFVPLIVAATSILSTLVLVLGVSYLGEVSFIVEFLVSLVGLASPSTTACCWSPVGARNARPAETTTTRSYVPSKRPAGPSPSPGSPSPSAWSP